MRERRCLVPVSGFYEWRRTPSGGKTKDKFAFQSQGGVDKGLMYLAGVYGEFLGGFRAGGFDGFAILTREADAQMRPYHDRMPVILDGEPAKKLWLLAPPQIPYDDLRRCLDSLQKRAQAHSAALISCVTAKVHLMYCSWQAVPK